MAVSGSTDFDTTVNDLVKYALRKINIIPVGQNVPGNLLKESKRELEELLKEWQREDTIWRKTDGEITLRAPSISGITAASPGVVTTDAAHGLIAGDRIAIESVSGMTEVNGFDFTVGTVPSTTTFQLSGTDTSANTAYTSGGSVRVRAYALTTTTPYRIVEARYRSLTGGLSRDIPMIDLTWEEYKELPIKTSTGIPTQFHYNPGRRNSVDVPLFYAWPVPASVSSGDAIEYSYQRLIDDLDAATSIDIPSDWISTVRYNLSARLADNFGRSGKHIDRVIARAEKLHEDALDADRDDMVRFEPEHRHG